MKKIKFIRNFVIVCMVISFGCTGAVVNKMACNDINQISIQKEKIYEGVLKSASAVLISLKNKDGKIPYADSSFISSSKIDSVIFFNEAKNKCLLLLLQQTVTDLKTDQIRIIQGTFKNGSWHFSYDRMPEVPEAIFSVDKQIQDNININNSFHFLSISGQKFVLTAGTTLDENCKIDMKYWFGD
ncbi:MULTISPECIES: hypothetical protein [Pedobacter]|uniref:hypothetical protein n=1 Tax=Pedobacter TaxID=84567 RepID=UPI00292D3ABF|nr:MULTISPECIES: hypothetical protein [Pedobacter]